MRGADGGPWKKICALPALWVGLLYDKQALEESLALISDWTQVRGGDGSPTEAIRLSCCRDVDGEEKDRDGDRGRNDTFRWGV